MHHWIVAQAPICVLILKNFINKNKFLTIDPYISMQKPRHSYSSAICQQQSFVECDAATIWDLPVNSAHKSPFEFV